MLRLPARGAIYRIDGRLQSLQLSVKHLCERKPASLVAARGFIAPAYELAKKMTPKMSATESAALKAGTIGFEGKIFGGDASLAYLKKSYSLPELSEEEARFNNNEVEKLCEMLDGYTIEVDRDLPKNVWDYMRSERFFGLCIPKKYGGRGFSAHGHSMTVTKIATRNPAACVTVMVPNSLGPAELFLRYGTEDQKDIYLPRLARGEIIPCFGLTSPAAGSDAANMRDVGIVVEEGGILGVRATFQKRYITLAPVAGIVGLAIKLKDPNGLLRGTGTEGITVFVLERGHPGLKLGSRHDPCGISFMNGPVEGENIFIPLSQIVGGQARAGFGWNMLMDCLAEGRSVSLPGMSVAATKYVLGTVGSYARVRKQFKVPLAEMEGIQEVMARIGGTALIAMSAQSLVNSMLNQHEEPAVISAMLKQQLTNRMRTVVNDGMDVLGGAGISNGPNNFLASSYTSVPIAITVEGANILTRSLIIFGQGLVRSHPHVLSTIQSIQKGNDPKGFNAALSDMIRHGTTNAGRAFARALTRSRIPSKTSFYGNEAFYESQLGHFTSAFALCSDIALTLGGKIKSGEMLSGRYADILSNIFLGYATLWFTSQHSEINGMEHIRDYAMQTLLHETEIAFKGIVSNFPHRSMSYLFRMVAFPTGMNLHPPPKDALVRQVSSLVTTDSHVRNLFIEDIFVSADPTDRVALLYAALPRVIEADNALDKIRKEKRKATERELALIDEADAMREIIIQVDSFAGLGREVQGSHHQPKNRPALDNIYD